LRANNQALTSQQRIFSFPKIGGIRNARKFSLILRAGIFPRGEKPTSNDKNANINKLIAKFSDDTVRFMDISNKFIQPDGSISKELMYDYLHLREKGFEVWVQAIEDSVKELMTSSNTAVLAGPGP
jgi:lysophospholipase L1-like esterase